MNRLFKNIAVAAIAVIAAIMTAKAQTPAEWEKLKGEINMYMANDIGRNGYYDQKPIAELMGTMAETCGQPTTNSFTPIRS